MHSKRVRDEISQVDIGLVSIVVDSIHTVQNHQPSPLTTVEPALDRSHRIFYLHHLVACIHLATREESVDLNIVPLDRLLRSSFDPEHGGIVLSIFADVIQHQLRLARSTEPPQHQDPHVFHPVILEVVQLFFDLLVQPRARNVVGDRSEGRVGVMALIRATGDLGSSRRI